MKEDVKDRNDKQLATIPSAEITEDIRIDQARPPKELDKEDRRKIGSEADAVIQRIMTAEGSKELDYIDQAANVGFKAQQGASLKLDMFQERMGRVLAKDSTTQKMTSDILALKDSLSKINPADIKKEWIFNFLKVLPFGNSLIRILRTIDLRRQRVESLVTTIEESLKTGRDMLVRDNAELVTLYKDMEDTQLSIQKNAYFAELMGQKLQDAIVNTEDDSKKAKLRNVLFRIITRDQDLRAMEEAYEQFFVSIGITRENNSLLVSTVQRMLTLGMNVITVAFAIHVALARQRDVLEAVRATRGFIGKMLESNAETIRRHVKEIGDLYKEPIIAIQSLEKAHTNLLAAIDEIDQLKTASIENAKVNIEKLKMLSDEMKRKRTGTQAGEITSLEADRLLPAGRGATA